MCHEQFVGNWINENDIIRYREVTFYDYDGSLRTEFEFEIFKRPYIFGLIGKKQWCWVCNFADIQFGLSFCLSLQ